MQIDKLIVDLSTDPFNPEKNFKAAVEYDKINQTASAVSFYLRAVEYGYKTHPLIAYTSLLKTSLCFERQKDRQATVLNNALQAAALLPERPEAYFLLSRIHERANQWQQCYTFAELGLTKTTQYLPELLASVEYYGTYCLLFEKAISGWWVGRKDESRELLLKLELMNTAPEYTIAIKNNLERLDIRPKTNEINPLEPVITNYRKFFGDSAPVVFDVGTRDGKDANFIAKALKSNTVYAIDANPLAVEKTLKSYPWMKIEQLAVSDFDGKSTFQQVHSGNENMDGCSSLFAEKVEKEPQFENAVTTIEVAVTRMDTFLNKQGLNGPIDVVKVDTEGYTWQVLQGFGARLNDVKLFHLETEAEPTHKDHKNNKEVSDFMEENGFVLVDLSYEGSMGLGKGIEDQIWVNPKLATRNVAYFQLHTAQQ